MAKRAGLCGLLARHHSPHALKRCDPKKPSAALLWKKCRLLYIWLRKAEVATTLCNPQVGKMLGRECERVAEHSRPVGAGEIRLARKSSAVQPAARQHPGDF